VSARGVAALVLLAVSIATPRDSCAQADPTAVPGRVEASVGVLWVGHQALGSGAATESTGSGGSLQLFTASSRLETATGVDAQIAVGLLRSLEAAVELSYAKPGLTVALDHDFENASPVVARETLQELRVGGNLLWYPWRRRSRLAPFASGGAGYLRQVHERGTLIETGRYYQFGGGVKYLFFSHPAGRLKALGARLDARALLRAKGVASGDTLHAAPALGAAMFARF
jgi:hypothetical protein